jgi:hypothetical protein
MYIKHSLYWSFGTLDVFFTSLVLKFQSKESMTNGIYESSIQDTSN